eukprot:5310669-Prymnesium_polylepis.1
MNVNPSPRPPSSPQHMPPCTREPASGRATSSHRARRQPQQSPGSLADRLSLPSRRNTAAPGRTCTSAADDSNAPR